MQLPIPALWAWEGPHRITDVGTETLVVDVCGFLASPFPYTLFPVTTSHVCGEPPLPTSIPCGFCGLGRTSHHAHSRDSVGSRLGIWSRASVSPVVSDWLRGRHIAQGRQVRANQSPLEGVHGLQVLPSDPDLNLETRWLKLGLPSCQLA